MAKVPDKMKEESHFSPKILAPVAKTVAPLRETLLLPLFPLSS